ncbi:hypothetical protein DD556_17330 [Phaeobacter sp. JL2872]|jgi:hypothetical protein|uniref:hypothetical protein n=1 Tax=Phaeobacter sp. JL2872 TaxID=2461377 RepID=UPI000D5EE6C6|nr:hypothetical protein [Phaeobacter sp. JL2872]MEE2635256.1 hypothetical protein [Pseudomonadota bacterium]PVZ45242.1 hypothetical protein DD556_17330 [Phaeobacter sp. JL2872]
MRICAIIPNDDWRQTAGVRIRYDRMRGALANHGIGFDLHSIESVLQEATPAYDTYLLCKCHDARSLALAARLKAAGRRLGVDVFDDYYSDNRDSSFVHLRNWFAQISIQADFFLCATNRMKQRLTALSPQVPCHVMNDPADSWNQADLAARLDSSSRISLQNRTLQIGWFGIGDNPYFQLGLDDLTAHGDLLRQCRTYGFEPHLHILTNRRALTPARLEGISRLGVPNVLEEWSEAREAKLIANSLLCFLPVNGQPFSTAKSLNRAVSVLTGGAQVLSANFPLYDVLDDFIYRDIGELLKDLQAGQLKMRSERLDEFDRKMTQLGSAEAEAGALNDFLSAVTSATPSEPGRKTGPVFVVHGKQSPAPVHQQLQRQGLLSVSTPRSQRSKLPHDVTVKPLIQTAKGTRIRIEFSTAGCAALSGNWSERVIHPHPDKPPYLDLFSEDMSDLGLALHPGLLAPPQVPPSALQELASYSQDMTVVREILNLLFDQPELILSELASPYPGAAIFANREQAVS